MVKLTWTLKEHKMGRDKVPPSPRQNVGENEKRKRLWGKLKMKCDEKCPGDVYPQKFKEKNDNNN